MKSLVFVHGWGFDSDFWKPVAELLPDFARTFVEFGFRAKPAHTPLVSHAIIVGHSMGFAWALENMPQPWAGAIAINGFARFTRAPDFVSGVAPRMVERMSAKFGDHAKEVTSDFLSRCGVDSPDVENINPEPLGRALEWLGKCDQRQKLAELGRPILALAGTRDSVVPEPMSREAFAAHPMTLVEGGGHMLPQTHPDWVAGQIRLFASGT